MPKLVAVEGIGNVEFPDEMDDRAISTVIQRHLPPAPGYRWKSANPYQTPLSSADEQKFQQWVKGNKIPFDPSPKSDYDMRGYWKDVASKGSQSGTQMKSDGLHFPDTYKTPYHHSASAESMYMPSDGPTWQGSDQAGWKLVDKNGRVVYDESNVKVLGPQQ
jgi:hypothetical protein